MYIFYLHTNTHIYKNPNIIKVTIGVMLFLLLYTFSSCSSAPRGPFLAWFFQLIGIHPRTVGSSRFFRYQQKAGAKARERDGRSEQQRDEGTKVQGYTSHALDRLFQFIAVVI